MEKISKNRDNAALCQVTFLREGRTVQVSAGSTIMNAARSTGIFPDAPCGNLRQMSGTAKNRWRRN